MAKTVTQIQEWLDSPYHIKCILADITYSNGTSDQTLYLSTQPYYIDNSPIQYLPIIVGGLSFSESMSPDLSISINYGSLELENTGGTYDYLLNYIYKRRNIELYIGDPSWPKSDFTLIFSGLSDNLVSSGESSLQLTIVDKLESLNEVLTTRTLKALSGYSTQNSQEEKLLPVLFGEAFNITPILVDNGTNFDTGPWSAKISGISSTSGIATGQTVTAASSIGRLYGGLPTSCTVTSIISNSAIIYTVQGGQRPLPGAINTLTINGAPYSGTLKITDITGTGGPIYKITDGTLNELIEVRDKAAPITVIADRVVPYGEFSLKYNSFGTITCSARSLPSVDCTIPNLIKYIVKNYGTNKLLDSDLDLLNIDSNRQSYKAGIYITDRVNILDVCNELGKSINCGLYYSPISISSNIVDKGKLRLIELNIPTTGSSIILDDTLMLEGTLQVTETFNVKSSIKLGYCKNYTQQPQDLALALNPDHGNVFSDQYWYVQKEDSSKITLYKDSGIVQEELTNLLVTSEAEAEATKRLNLWKIPRQLITATYLPHLIFTQLGDIVTIKSNRFNLSSGKIGIVYSINRNWITGFVEIGVLV